jgi:hypothetical protein
MPQFFGLRGVDIRRHEYPALLQHIALEKNGKGCTLIGRVAILGTFSSQILSTPSCAAHFGLRSASWAGWSTKGFFA